METVCNVFLKSDKSFEINEISQVPLVLNTNQYNYYLSLLSFSFLNCSPNITGNQTFTFKYLQTEQGEPVEHTVTKNIEDGLYDTQDILDLINSYFNFTYTNPSTGITENAQVVTIAINPFNEYTELEYSQSEASKVMIRELQGLGFDVGIYTADKKEVELEKIDALVDDAEMLANEADNKDECRGTKACARKIRCRF